MSATQALTVGAGRGIARPRPASIVKYTLLSVFALPWVVLPLWMLLVNSVKSEGEAAVPTLGLPSEWAAWENYATVISDGNYFTALRNSLLVAVPSIALIILLGSMAAWAYARTSSMSLKTLYFVSALSIILPPAIIPSVFVLTQVGLNGSMLGYALTIIGTRLGVVVFIATGFVQALPTSYEEAAQIDGANRWQIYWHVVLPLLAPVLFTAAVLLVISVWNDFFFALFLLQGSESATLPLALYQFANSGTYGVRWNLVFANVVLTSLPLLIAYILLQRRVLAGLTEGGVTG